MTLFRRRVLLKEIEFCTEIGVEHIVKLMAGRIDEIARSVELVAVMKEKMHVCFELLGVLLLALVKLCPYRTEIHRLLNDAVVRRLRFRQHTAHRLGHSRELCPISPQR